MKKFTILLMLLFIGCSNKKNINLNNITNIKYNNIEILESDYQSINDLLKQINFSNKEINIDYTNKLVIVTNNELYNIYLSNNYYIKYEKNDKLYYSKNTKNNKILIDYLESLYTKYTNTNFFNISYIKNYDENDIIKLDSSDNYILIELHEQIYDFKIHEIDDENLDVNLLYENDDIENKKIAIRKTIDNKNNIRITFKNAYNNTVSIIPILNNENVEFDTSFSQK